MRQCPKCKVISKLSSPACESCGLQFFKVPSSRRQKLTAACFRIGGGAILLAVAAAVVLRLT